jgi:hypothetical protein
MRRTMARRLVNPVVSGYFVTATAQMLPNYALERSVKSKQQCAAGARNNFAPAALGPRLARSAQRGR